MNPKFPEKKFKRSDKLDTVKGKTEKNIFPFLIFLVITFIVAYLFFNNYCFG
jgi:hypothetical protein